MTTATTNQLLFQFIYQSVIEEGGDGDAVIGFLAQDYSLVANEFEIFLKDNSEICWAKQQTEKYIVFENYEESFIFTDCKSFPEIPNYSHRLLVI